MANHAAIEQQYRHLQPELAGQLGVGVHVDDPDLGYGLRAFQLGERQQHVLAQVTTLAAQNHESLGKTR